MGLSRDGEPGVNILFINRVFPPQPGATGELLAELARGLCRRGHSVTILTSRPATTSAEAHRSFEEAGLRIVRVRGFPFARVVPWQRVLADLSLFPGWLVRGLAMAAAEVVVTMTDPPLQAVLGPLLKTGRRVRRVHWAQDLYPEVAEELGVLVKNGMMARWLRQLSTWALRRHDHIVAVGACMKERFLARGISEHTISVIPNWALATTFAGTLGMGMEFRRAYGAEKSLLVMYAGNLGLAHEFGGILGAAEILDQTTPEIMFLFAGNGLRCEEVTQYVRRRGLGNVRFLPPQPAQQLAEMLTAADIHLVSMRPNVLGLVVPSKIYGVVAAGRPCVFLGPENSEAARLIRRTGCGVVLSPTDAHGLAACLRRWLHQREELETMRRAALHAREEVTLDRILPLFENVLLNSFSNLLSNRG